MPNASVIITTYKRADFFLSRAIESVLAQETDFRFEILVLDDNGVNSEAQLATQLVMQPYIERNKIVYIPLAKNSGACLARNKGIELAEGKYIFFLDDDDVYLPNKLQTQVDFLNNNTELDGCLAAFKRVGENNLEINATSNFPVVGDFKNFVIYGNFFTPMLCIKKTSLLKIGGFHFIERFQDQYLLLHALVQGYRFICIEAQLHIMYEHKGNRITNKSISVTIDSLNVIKNFIQKYKAQFSASEWQTFLKKDLRKRGDIFYISENYKDRVIGSIFYFKAFKLSGEMNDLKMAFKSILKV